MKEPNQILQEHLSERIAANSGYSLRAFARDLEISPQQLSNVMNGRKGLSEKMAAQIAERLGYNTSQKNMFCELARAKFSRSKAQREISKVKLAHLQQETATVTHLEMDLFKIISNWHHLALVELIKIKTSKKKNVGYLSSCLSLPENEVALALGRLERLGLISKEGASWKVNQDTVIADRGIVPEAIRNFHRQVIAKSLHAMEAKNEQERYGSSSFFPTRVRDLKKAKAMIQDFRMKFASELADKDEGAEVFGLSIQFFQVTENNPKTSPKGSYESL
jgi:uncharacterized protein (TIGR02147 family)